MMAPASLVWFARHEFRLAWRDAILMMQGGRRGRGLWAGVAAIVFLVVMHLVAYGILAASIDAMAAS